MHVQTWFWFIPFAYYKPPALFFKSPPQAQIPGKKSVSDSDRVSEEKYLVQRFAPGGNPDLRSKFQRSKRK
jgi:hypothetical protein